MVFGAWANRYFEHGLNVMPVIGKNQPTIGEFQKWSKIKMTENDIENLCSKESNKNANIGLLTGEASGIIAFDFDYVGPNAKDLEKIILDILPETQAIKIGKKGFTKFYKFNGHSSIAKKIPKDKSPTGKQENIFEIISTGRYTILPPSIHPDTGTPYIWANGEPDSYSNLPELPGYIIGAIIEAIDAFFGLKKDSGRNYAIWGYALKCIHEHDTYDSWKNKLIEYDKKKFGDNSWFKDSEERGRLSVEQFTDKMCQSWLKSIKKIKKTYDGIDFEFGKEDERELSWPKDKDLIIKKYPRLEEGFIWDEEIETKNGPKTKRHYLTNEFSDFMIDIMGARTYDGSYTYLFDGKKHVLYKDNQVKKIIQTFVYPGLKPVTIEQYYKDLLLRSQIFGKKPQGEDGKINLLNGVFDINKMQLSEHSKKNFFLNNLNISYDPNAKCPEWLKFLDDIFSGDVELIETMQRIFGYVLMGGERFLHKSFVLYGSGRNGKGVVLRMLKTILGESSYSVVGMDLLDKPFSLVALDGVLANISDETPTNVNSAMFKKIVAGEEIVGSYKGKDEYKFTPKCVMLFACNDFPHFDDKNTSLLDRLFIIPFKKTYREGIDRDPDKFNKLIVEAPGVLNWAIEGAKIVSKERVISPPKSVSNIKTEYREETDPVFSWFNEKVKISPIPVPEGEGILSTDLHHRYKVWAESCGHNVLSHQKFSKRLSRIVKEQLPFSDCPKVITTVGNVRGKGYDILKYKKNDDC